MSVFVSRGSIEELQILVNEVVSNGWTFNLTADQTIDAEIRPMMLRKRMVSTS